MDENRIWHLVAGTRDNLNAVAPDGFEPVVEVYLSNREAPIIVTEVMGRREFDPSWVFLTAGGEETAKDDRVVFVRMGDVRRIELTFVPKGGRRTGFSYDEADASRNE